MRVGMYCTYSTYIRTYLLVLYVQYLHMQFAVSVKSHDMFTILLDKGDVVFELCVLRPTHTDTYVY